MTFTPHVLGSSAVALPDIESAVAESRDEATTLRAMVDDAVAYIESWRWSGDVVSPVRGAEPTEEHAAMLAGRLATLRESLLPEVTAQIADMTAFAARAGAPASCDILPPARA